MARHAVALEDVVRIGVHADRAAVAMHLFHAVAGPLAGEVMPLHDPRRAAALGHPGDIDRLDLGQVIDAELLADFQPPAGRHAELADKPLRFAGRLGDRLHPGRPTPLLSLALQTGDLTAGTATGKASGFVPKAQLDRLVSVPQRRPHLEDRARPGLDHRHGDALAGGAENLRHPDLAAE